MARENLKGIVACEKRNALSRNVREHDDAEKDQSLLDLLYGKS
jgi:hypothetical protein